MSLRVSMGVLKAAFSPPCSPFLTFSLSPSSSSFQLSLPLSHVSLLFPPPPSSLTLILQFCSAASYPSLCAFSLPPVKFFKQYIFIIFFLPLFSPFLFLVFQFFFPSVRLPPTPTPPSSLCGAFLPLKYRIPVGSFLFTPRRYVLSTLLAADNDLPLLL